LSARYPPADIPNPEPEASIRGAAVYAIEKMGGKPAPLKLPAPIRPRRKFAALYAKQRERQVKLEEAFVRMGE
jgi:gluconokinase